MDKILQTALYASEMHKFQTRKSDGSSYICHPLAVANILLECDVNDIEILQAAILHDVVEDTSATIKNIREKFGDNVADYVYEVTDDRSLSKIERKKLQVEHSKVISDGAKLIKGADAYHNLLDLLISPPKNWNRNIIKGYFVWKRVITNNIRGINEKLDKKLDELFDSFLEPNLNLEKELQKYYDILNQKN